MNLGVAWGDHVKGESDFTLQVGDGVIGGSRLGWWWWAVLLIGMGLLVGRLVQLQLVYGEASRLQADQQRIRLLRIPAARGIIYDRQGEQLVRNVPIFRRVEFDPEVGIELVLISRQQALDLSTGGQESAVIEGVGREYLYGEVLSHVLGYVGEVGAEEVGQVSTESSAGVCPESYRVGDIVGKVGVERAFDCALRGTDGESLVEVNTAGALVRQVGRRKSQPGERLDLTLDLRWQQLAVEAMAGQVGAVLVSEPGTGEILAMASAPGFDPKYFSTVADDNLAAQTDQIMAWLQDEQRPLVNRAIAAVYPPGSIFKLVTATAGLETKQITASELYKDTGVVRLGEYNYTNWYYTQYGGVEGNITLAGAIARSTDTLFYELAGSIGVEALSRWGQLFGLGRETGLDMGGELAGLMPDSEWKERVIGERWYLGNTYHLGIGQGDLLVTPLQANALTAVFANEGRWCRPHIIQSPVISDQLSEGGCRDLGIGEETIQTILTGMVQACRPGGTAAPFFDWEMQFACKTGTAEFGVANKEGEYPTHAWFSALGPVVNQEGTWHLDANFEPVVITVLIEAGGEGSKVAAPVAREVLERWYSNSSQ